MINAAVLLWAYIGMRVCLSDGPLHILQASKIHVVIMMANFRIIFCFAKMTWNRFRESRAHGTKREMHSTDVE